VFGNTEKSDARAHVSKLPAYKSVPRRWRSLSDLASTFTVHGIGISIFEPATHVPWNLNLDSQKERKTDRKKKRKKERKKKERLCQQGDPCLHEIRNKFMSGASTRQTPTIKLGIPRDSL